MTGQPAYQNVSIPVEHSSELLQDFEMESWCEHLAVGPPLVACKIHDWQLMIYVTRKTGCSSLLGPCAKILVNPLIALSLIRMKCSP